MEQNVQLYHVIAINEKTGKGTFCTMFPVDHYKACILAKRFTYNKFRRIQLKEA